MWRELLPSQNVEEQIEHAGENRGAQEKAGRQGEDPGHDNVPQSTLLQAGSVGKHGLSLSEVQPPALDGRGWHKLPRTNPFSNPDKGPDRSLVTVS